jgi:hypothetical protein
MIGLDFNGLLDELILVIDLSIAYTLIGSLCYYVKLRMSTPPFSGPNDCYV